MIWIFLLTLGAGLAVTFAALDIVPAAHRRITILCGSFLCTAFALGLTIDLHAIITPR